MENSYNNEELLVKYLMNELGADEEATVTAWINENEKNLRFFEELKNTWKVTAIKNTSQDVDLDFEWKQFSQKISFKKLKEEQDRIRRADADFFTPVANKNIFKFVVSAVAAASIILAIAFGFGIFGTGKQIDADIAKEEVTTEAPVPFIRVERNTSGKRKEIVLQDGSAVTLFDKSEISFQEPFAGDRRDITLKGKATFSVAKDKTKPFTVFSGNVSTTALGTRFTVTAFDHEEFITVRLFEGKVVVKPNYNLTLRTDEDIYLTAGQEVIFNRKRSTAKVRKFEGNTPAKSSVKERPVVEALELPTEKGSWFMFNNQPVEKIFDELENMFGVDIKYNKTDIQNMYFIGKFESNDSVEIILNQIAGINNLKVTRQNKSFVITKR